MRGGRRIATRVKSTERGSNIVGVLKLFGPERREPFTIQKQRQSICTMIEQNMCKDVRVGCDDQNSKECLKKINQEINLLNLSHPNIVQYHGSELMMNNDDINEEMQDFEEEKM
ncbi:mitogen-activated protein kinase kinase kinase [Trifolium repens]|nr:mitogen-activated protein kinase kinase kinase [Trifolium repens]